MDNLTHLHMTPFRKSEYYTENAHIIHVNRTWAERDRLQMQRDKEAMARKMMSV